MKHLSEYEKYLNLIKEGLTRTYSIEKYHSNLEIELYSLKVEFTLNIINKFSYELEIYNPTIYNNDMLLYILSLNSNILGYYPSYIWVTNKMGEIGFKYDKKYINNKYLKIKVRFEAKYEDGLYTNDLTVPEYAYHLSPMNKKDKILNDGLYPKTRKRKSEHPERIYFFYDIENTNELLNSLKRNDTMNNIDINYILCKVKIPTDIIIHSDPNYEGGFFIYDFILPKNIEILMENL